MCVLIPCRPDGQKKAYVRLAPDYDALDVANKVSRWQDVLVFNCNLWCHLFPCRLVSSELSIVYWNIVIV